MKKIIDEIKTFLKIIIGNMNIIKKIIFLYQVLIWEMFWEM